jgi:hypothetical protein
MRVVQRRNVVAFNRFLFGSVLLLSGWVALAAAAGDTYSFWVWHRHDPLGAVERMAVARMQASLLWHVGELDVSDTSAAWRWRDALAEPGAIPAIRVNLSGSDPFKMPGLVENIAAQADATGRLQVDCDCPDRLLAEYARFLGNLRRDVPHLSATALAGWSSQPAFGDLQGSVEELDVMFYDLTPDAPNIGPNNPPQPLLDERTFATELASWQACKIPWRAGLPNFNRVTVFDSTGHSLGQIRNWSWDEVMFQPRLKFVSAAAPGLVLMKAAGDFVMADTPIKSGALVAIRWVNRETLAHVLTMVTKSSATGVVFFRLPDSTDPSGWSVSQLAELTHGRVQEASLRLRKQGDCLVLQNDSAADLPPRIAGDADRGYALEVDAPVQLWREAGAGDFWRVASHANPEKAPVAVPVPFATRLTFWFAGLRAGESLKTGFIQLAPDADIRQIRYRILPQDQKWKPLE